MPSSILRTPRSKGRSSRRSRPAGYPWPRLRSAPARMFRRQLELFKRPRNKLRTARLAELDGRQIHRHDHRQWLGVLPLHLAHGHAQDQSPIGRIRPLSSAIGMKSPGETRPSSGCVRQQHFDADHAPSTGVRLVVQFQLIEFERATQGVFQLQGPVRTLLHFAREEAEGRAPALLGAGIAVSAHIDNAHNCRHRSDTWRCPATQSFSS